MAPTATTTGPTTSPPSPPEESLLNFPTLELLTRPFFRRKGASRKHSPSPSPPQMRPVVYTPPPLSPLELSGYSASTNTKLLPNGTAEEIRAFLPARWQLPDQWQLVYSLEQHGASLQTMYDLVGESRGWNKNGGGGVIVVRDMLGGTFGAFLNEPLLPHGRYFGSGECFLWKKTPTEEDRIKGDSRADGVFKVFPYTGKNDYVLLCDSSGLSVGGGDGKTGLYLDDRFQNGTSDTCDTFLNESLTEGELGRFDILGVELWRIGLES